MDETQQLAQVLKVAPLTAAHVVDEAAPHGNMTLAIERFVPDTNNKGMGIVLHRIASPLSYVLTPACLLRASALSHKFLGERFPKTSVSLKGERQKREIQKYFW